MRYNCCDILREKLKCLNSSDNFNFKEYLLKNKELVIYNKDAIFLYIDNLPITVINDPSEFEVKTKTLKYKCDIFFIFKFNKDLINNVEKKKINKIYCNYYENIKVIGTVPDKIPDEYKSINLRKGKTFTKRGIAIVGEEFIETNCGTADSYSIQYIRDNIFNVFGGRFQDFNDIDNDEKYFSFLGPNNNGVLSSIEERNKVLFNKTIKEEEEDPFVKDLSKEDPPFPIKGNLK